jgi:hypothetical protein
MLGVVADALQVIADPHRTNAFAQIDRHRLAPGDREDAFVLNLALQCVDSRIDRDDALAKLDVAVDQGLNRIGDLPLYKPAHLGDLAGDFLQIDVEGFGGVIDFGADVSHLRYPKRPVM